MNFDLIDEKVSSKTFFKTIVKALKNLGLFYSQLLYIFNIQHFSKFFSELRAIATVLFLLLHSILKIISNAFK